MNGTEFAEWVGEHTAAFGGLKDWLRRNDDCLPQWRKCLTDVSLLDAMAATDAMNCGDEPSPKGFGDHARAVRKIAKRLSYQRSEGRKQYIDGQETFDCPHCQDSGWVEIVNHSGTGPGKGPLRSFFADKTQYLPVCAIACSCRGSATGPVFDPDRFFVVNHNAKVKDEAERFRKWWAEGRYLGSRNKAFDDWNDRGE